VSRLWVVPDPVELGTVTEESLNERGNQAITRLRDAHQDMLAHIGLPYIWGHEPLDPYMSRDLIRQARQLADAADQIRQAALSLETVLNDAQQADTTRSPR
jgi:hypothetical protein